MIEAIAVWLASFTEAVQTVLATHGGLFWVLCFAPAIIFIEIPRYYIALVWACVMELTGRHTHGNRLAARDRRGDSRERGLRWLATQTPVVGPLGPEHPAARVRLELAGHTVAVATRVAVECLCHGCRRSAELWPRW